MCGVRKCFIMCAMCDAGHESCMLCCACLTRVALCVCGAVVFHCACYIPVLCCVACCVVHDDALHFLLRAQDFVYATRASCCMCVTHTRVVFRV